MSKKKIAILGGGMGALTAAWVLSHEPDEYDITVYQLGWRLGGKTTTGRGRHQRIQEHGIHVLMGWYDNTFRLLRSVYDERRRDGLDPDSPLQTWEQSVVATNVMSMPQYDARARKWAGWTLVFPRNHTVPGGPPVSMMELVKEAVVLTIELIFGIDPPPLPAAVPPGDDGSPAVKMPKDLSGDQLAKWIASRLDVKTNLFATAGKDDARRAVKALVGDIDRPADYRIKIGNRTAHPRDHLFSFLADLVKWLNKLASMVEQALQDAIALLKRALGSLLRDVNVVLDAVLAALDAIAPFGSWLQHIILMLDFLLVNVRGLFATVYDPRTGKFDFQRVDPYDYREWLLMNGGNKALVDSVIVRFFYTGTFSNLVGGEKGGLISAAVALRGMFSFVGYKTAPVFLLTAGTGDTFVMPVYQVLKSRGVKFEFFSKVESLTPGAGGDIESVSIGIQVDLKNPAAGYQPTIEVGPGANITAWPAKPLYDQIDPAQAAELIKNDIDLESPWSPWTNVGRKVLQKGTDFDTVILGIPVGALSTVCKELIDTNVRWKNMVLNVKTTATQSLQIWAKPTMEELGLFRSAARVPKVPCPVGCVTYADGQFSWGDYSCTLWSEAWPVADAPRTAIYFGGALPDGDGVPPFSDHGYPARMKERVTGANIQWLVSHGAFFWPSANPNPELPQSFDLNALVSPDDPNAPGFQRALAQYHHAAVNPSDRYTLAVPGSNVYRMKAGDSEYSNLVLAGDWIDYGLNAGYIEGAVISGHEAAHAVALLSGHDSAPIEAYRHPDILW
ncbi:MAG: NAD(P)-binding protein [Polyangiaceae bacterium]